MDELSPLLDLVQSFGYSALFLWLYIYERKAHSDTRARYFEDLREWAAISHVKGNPSPPTAEIR